MAVKKTAKSRPKGDFLLATKEQGRIHIMFYRKRRRKTRITLDYLKNKEKARAALTEKVERYNSIYKHQVRRISIRNPKTRWASCSAKGNLNFSYKILFLEDRLANYIVVHELCHLKELNHSQRFWSLVAQVIPNYKQIRKELRETKIIRSKKNTSVWKTNYTQKGFLPGKEHIFST